jgi:hypothetical protein
MVRTDSFLFQFLFYLSFAKPSVLGPCQCPLKCELFIIDVPQPVQVLENSMNDVHIEFMFFQLFLNFPAAPYAVREKTVSGILCSGKLFAFFRQGM